jgi:hypothetical protein
MVRWWAAATLATLAVGACSSGSPEPPARGATMTTTTTTGGPTVYEVSATVLESPEHGPQLCLGVILTSLPPQCDGPDVEGWDWDAIGTEESSAGTTWADVHVVGTYDRATFTLTEPPRPSKPGEDSEPDGASDFSPACDDPTVVDPAAGAAAWEAASQDKGMPPMPTLVAAWVSSEPFVANVVVLPGHGRDVEALVREYYDGPLCVVERDAPTAEELRQVQREVNTAGRDSPLGVVLMTTTDERHGVIEAQIAVADDAARAYARERWGDRVRLIGRLQPVD